MRFNLCCFFFFILFYFIINITYFVLQSNSESLTSSKCYTPLDALSNMQPPPGPGIQHGVTHPHMGPPHQHVLPLPQHQLSPGRRHGCPSAFTAPLSAPPYPPPPPSSASTSHHHPSQLPPEPGYIHGKQARFVL